MLLMFLYCVTLDSVIRHFLQAILTSIHVTIIVDGFDSGRIAVGLNINYPFAANCHCLHLQSRETKP